MAEIDLDAIAAEVDDEQPVVVFGGEKFTLPARLPWRAISMMGRGEIDEALNLVLGDQAEAFWGHEPNDRQIEALFEGLADAYGMESLGESSASGVSSASNGDRSRPTSSTTASTSRKRSSAPRR